jgi:hypothetical protein
MKTEEEVREQLEKEKERLYSLKPCEDGTKNESLIDYYDARIKLLIWVLDK